MAGSDQLPDWVEEEPAGSRLAHHPARQLYMQNNKVQHEFS